MPDAEGNRPERRVAINSGLLLLAFSFQAAVSLIVVGLVARYLGQAGLGRYGYIISFIELFIAFIDLGMNRILVRDISRDLDRAGLYASVIWTVRLMLALLALVFIAILAAGSGDQSLWLPIMVYYLAQTLFLLADVFNSVFHGFQRMEYQFWGINLSQVLLLGFTAAVIWLNLGLVALFAARLAANGIKLLFVWWVSERHFAHARVVPGVLQGALLALVRLPGVVYRLLTRNRDAAKAFLAAGGRALGKGWQDAQLAWHMVVESLPVGISLVLRSYIWRIGIVLTVLWLGQEQGDLVNGLLYGPLRVIQQLRIVPASFAAAMLPVFSNRAISRQQEFDIAFGKSIKLFTAISLLIALAFTFLADPIVALLLGQSIDLTGAAQVLSLLAWVIVLYFPNWLFGVTLVALGRQRLETLGLALGLAIGLLVAWLTIPQHGALGVALSIIGAEAVFFLIGTAAMWTHFQWHRLLPSLLKIVAACAAAGAVFAAGHRVWWQLADNALAPGTALTALLELVLVGTLGILAFAATLWLLKAFDEEEMEGIRAMLQLRRGGA